jgi:hypothetical protein
MYLQANKTHPASVQDHKKCAHVPDQEQLQRYTPAEEIR